MANKLLFAKNILSPITVLTAGDAVSKSVAFFMILAVYAVKKFLRRPTPAVYDIGLLTRRGSTIMTGLARDGIKIFRIKSPLNTAGLRIIAILF